ncbi:MAG: hypothetical protein EA362_10975 [Saprospirales bacterium]|nr:MAG: hypothetical protein EA362_10975 [Saprospirales bacterium]
MPSKAFANISDIQPPYGYSSSRLYVRLFLFPLQGYGIWVLGCKFRGFIWELRYFWVVFFVRRD